MMNDEAPAAGLRSRVQAMEEQRDDGAGVMCDAAGHLLTFYSPVETG